MDDIICFHIVDSKRKEPPNLLYTTPGNHHTHPLQRNSSKNQVLSRLVSDPYYPAGRSSSSSSRKLKQRQEAEREKKQESHPISFDGPLTPRGCQKTRKRNKKKNTKGIEREAWELIKQDGTYRVVQTQWRDETDR
jgi:hypothetical protein